VLLKPQTQTVCVDPHYGVELGIIGRLAAIQGVADERLLEIQSSAGEFGLYEERKQAAKSGGFDEAGAPENSL
jgi:hypothetical protein